MSKLSTTALATACAVLFAGAASAATWNFEADATSYRNSNQKEGTFDQVYPGTSATRDGISLSAAGYIDADNDGVPDDTGDTAITPFMDAGNAGLGVCKTGFDVSVDESQCSTGYNQTDGTGTYAPGDDNLVSPEVLKLTFGHEVLFESLKIRNGGHKLVDGWVLISLDGTFDNTTDKYTLSSGMVDLTGLGSSDMFWFTSYNEGNVARPEVYLDTLTASKVPVPAALPMLLAGVGGLGFIARRRRKSY